MTLAGVVCTLKITAGVPEPVAEVARLCPVWRISGWGGVHSENHCGSPRDYGQGDETLAKVVCSQQITEWSSGAHSWGGRDPNDCTLGGATLARMPCTLQTTVEIAELTDGVLGSQSLWPNSGQCGPTLAEVACTL